MINGARVKKCKTWKIQGQKGSLLAGCFGVFIIINIKLLNPEKMEYGHEKSDSGQIEMQIDCSSIAAPGKIDW